MKTFVYIIEDRDGLTYIGQSNNVPRRQAQHAAGKSGMTAHFNGHKIRKSYECPDLLTALKLERYLQRVLGDMGPADLWECVQANAYLNARLRAELDKIPDSYQERMARAGMPMHKIYQSFKHLPT